MAVNELVWIDVAARNHSDVRGVDVVWGASAGRLTLKNDEYSFSYSDVSYYDCYVRNDVGDSIRIPANWIVTI